MGKIDSAYNYNSIPTDIATFNDQVDTITNGGQQTHTGTNVTTDDIDQILEDAITSGANNLVGSENSGTPPGEVGGAVPIENNYGSGTILSHFEEDPLSRQVNGIVYPTVPNELMTGFASTYMYLTPMTSGVLQDIGFTINENSPWQTTTGEYLTVGTKGLYALPTEPTETSITIGDDDLFKINEIKMESGLISFGLKKGTYTLNIDENSPFTLLNQYNGVSDPNITLSGGNPIENITIDDPNVDPEHQGVYTFYTGIVTLTVTGEYLTEAKNAGIVSGYYYNNDPLLRGFRGAEDGFVYAEQSLV